MIKAILFDFNGVIIDDEPLQLEAYKNVLREEGIELTEKDYYDSLGMNDVAFVRAAYERSGKPLEDKVLTSVLERKSAAHREMLAGELPFFDGVINFIKMARHHFKLGVVSMARRDEITDVLKRGGIYDAFSILVSADEVTSHKPNPECYNLGFRKIDKLNSAHKEYPLIREDVLVIEDAPPGVLAAKSAGLQVLGVTNTVSDKELRRAGAGSVTKTLADWTPETVELVFR